MKNFILLSAFLFPLFIQGQNNNFQNLVSYDLIKKHVYTLASDSMEGRNATLKGQKMAAKYIANLFSEYSLIPASSDSAPYYQQIQVIHNQYGKITLLANDNTYTVGNHFLFYSKSDLADSIDLQPTFMGYNGFEKTDSDNNQACLFFARDIHEAAAIIEKQCQLHSFRYFFFALPNNNKFVNKELRKFRYRTEDIYPDIAFSFMNKPYKDFDAYFKNIDPLVKVIMIDDYLFHNLSGIELKKASAVAQKKAKKGVAADIAIFPFKMAINYLNVRENKTTENIIGYIEGTSLKNEYIIIGAHYDHVGKQAEEIYYGADDNASGTAAILELARLFAIAQSQGYQPERSLVFIAFTAEEKGLCGSAYYVAHPVFNLNQTKYMINFDMIGRSDKKRQNAGFVYLKTFKDDSRKIKRYSKQVDKQLNDFKIDRSPGFPLGLLYRFGSDHYSFVKKDIASSVFFTGLHNDYHTPRDTPDKIKYNNMVNVVKTAYLMIDKLANPTKQKK